MRNEEIRARAGVAKIRVSENIREARLRWFGHVERKTEEDVVMKHGSGWTRTGRPNLRRSDVI